MQTAPTVTASFLASAVECVEAATIVLAVGTVRGWRSAPIMAPVMAVGCFAILVVAIARAAAKP